MDMYIQKYSSLLYFLYITESYEFYFSHPDRASGLTKSCHDSLMIKRKAYPFAFDLLVSMYFILCLVLQLFQLASEQRPFTI